MNFPPASFVTLVHLLRRDGFSFFGKCARYAFSRDAWRWLLRGGRGPFLASGSFPAEDVRLVAESGWFDAEWFCREHPEVVRSGMPPAEYYLLAGKSGIVSPGPDFVGDEYLALNLDVAAARLNPLLHFCKYGATRSRQISFLEISRSRRPEGTVECILEFAPSPPRSRRVAIFAAHSGSGRIREANLVYLRGLKEVVDEIVYVDSAGIFPEEIEKLGGLVRFAVFEEHDEYDFGSYNRGYKLAEKRGLLGKDRCDELVVCNDSCYGPVVPFSIAFRDMEPRKCDFWGLTAYEGFGHEHIQSYFFVFRRRVLDGRELGDFLAKVKREISREHVIFRYETQLTHCLQDAGYSADTLVPWNWYRSERGKRIFPPAMPVTIVKRWHVPLVKVKTVAGENDESPEQLHALVLDRNPELAAAIPVPRSAVSEVGLDHGLVRNSRIRHAERLVATVDALRARIARKKKIAALFLASDPSMFPAAPLCRRMMADPDFTVKIVVFPDFRWPDAIERMVRCRNGLSEEFPQETVFCPKPGPLNVWPDVIGDFGADIVCYSTPYDISAFTYNPHWAVGRDFLPIHVNYGFYRSVYDRNIMSRQNYAYFWKAFFECDATAKEYAEHSILKGANAEVVGYVKMDALATAKPWPRNGNRKRVLIAPHHSVEGGANDSLALSNFQRYADYFLDLPAKHPEIDFVFRPHPYLFTVLSRPDKWGQAKVDSWIARMKSHPNVRWSDEGDYFPVFASCDAAVQDCGSYLVEWFYTGKPCCYMLKDPSDIDSKFAPLGKQCLSHCCLAYDEAAIENFLREVVEGGADPKAAARDDFRKSVMVNYPHAADAALASIKKELGLK